MDEKLRPDWMTEVTPEDELPDNFYPNEFDERKILTQEMVEWLEERLEIRRKKGGYWFDEHNRITMEEVTKMVKSYKTNHDIKTT